MEVVRECADAGDGMILVEAVRFDETVIYDG
jgi:hypothetical protein